MSRDTKAIFDWFGTFKFFLSVCFLPDFHSCLLRVTQAQCPLSAMWLSLVGSEPCSVHMFDGCEESHLDSLVSCFRLYNFTPSNYRTLWCSRIGNLMSTLEFRSESLIIQSIDRTIKQGRSTNQTV